jgi:hypothetical protein
MVSRRPDPPRASPGRAIGEGWRRTAGAPALIAGLLIATAATAVPFGMLVAPEDWQRRGLSEALFALVDPSPAHWSSRWALPATVSYVSSQAALAVQDYAPILMWLFFAGGALDRLARARPLRTAAFFAACGVYFFRFLRLAALFVPIYWAVGWLPWIIEPIADVSPVAARALSALLLTAVGLVLDFAMIRMVVEDRRSAIGALLSSLRFVRRHMIGAVVVFAVHAVLAWAVVALWMPAPLTILSALVLALLRIFVMFAWMASEIALFQDSLAHAGYTAAPPAVWPQSASVEAIRNLSR